MATRGQSFSNLNTKLAVLGIIWGHIGMKLGRIGPRPLVEVLFGPLEFLATRGPSLFSTMNPKLAVLDIIWGHFVIKLGIICLWPYIEVP